MSKNILNRYKELLGEYCAVNQFVELSKRVFMSEHTEADNPELFQKIAENNRLTLTAYDISKVNHKVSLNYIISVHLCFDLFLQEINEEVKKYCNISPMPTKSKDESWLVYISGILLENSIPTEIKGLIELCEYYRLIRNCAGHGNELSREAKLQYRKLSGYEFKTNSKFARLSAPNQYSDIQFDDFVMFARSSQWLAGILYKNLKYDYEKILASINLKDFRKYSANHERMKKALSNYIITYYKDDDSLSDRISDFTKKQ